MRRESKGKNEAEKAERKRLQLKLTGWQRVYGRKGQTPASRLGSAWMMRAQFEKAKKLISAQEKWCSSPNHSGDFPTDLSLDSLVSLLLGTARLHCHCYKVQDLEMMIRLSREFGFVISAFHHALEAYKLAPV